MKQKLLDLLDRHTREGIAVTPGSRLREDLELNSLSMMMILWETEQMLGRELDLSKLGGVNTVGELLEALETEA